MIGNLLKVAFGIILTLLITWFLIRFNSGDRDLEVIFFSVGQGDSALIISPGGQTMLIDGGPNDIVIQKLGKYLPPLKKRIDIAVLTHPHADHIVGLIEVLRRYEVGAVVLSGVYLKSDNFSEFVSALKINGAVIVIAESGEAIHFGPSSENLEFAILASGGKLSDEIFNEKSEGFGTAGGDLNDTSIVGKLIFKDFSIIFSGDATIKVENQLAAWGKFLDSDILKVGHHGSKYSSSLGFLRSVSPQAAVINLGAKNFYGFPSEAALSRIGMVGAGVFRTDNDGDIKISSNGATTRIYKEK